jgi:hypothetical protein
MEETDVLSDKAAPSLLILMGSLDWLTTIVGVVYFGAVEGNPFLVGLVSSNLLVFSVIKLGTSFFVGFLFFQANKILNRVEDKSNCFIGSNYMLKGGYITSLIFLLVAVVNNILTVTGKPF